MKNNRKFSVVIPVYNEEVILRKSIESLVKDIQGITEFNNEYEIILSENGSNDDTHKVAEQLKKEFSVIRIKRLKHASYGQSLKLGIQAALNENIIIFNIDFWDIEFLKKALMLLDEYDCVVGSKVIKGSIDERPLLRRLITRGFNLLLNYLFGFKGTDTHGIKGLRKSSFFPISLQCLTERDIFDTELMLRAERAKLLIHELPVTIREVRLTRLEPLKRVASTLQDLVTLHRALKLDYEIPLKSVGNKQQSNKKHIS